VRTDKCKEFLNKHFQDMLRDKGIQYQVCRNPDLKCAVVERVHRTIRDRLYKYFTYRNKYRYIDVLPKFVNAYNDTVHSTTGKAASRVTDLPYGRGWRQPRGEFASRKRHFGWGSTSASAKRRCDLPNLPNRISARRYSRSRKYSIGGCLSSIN